MTSKNSFAKFVQDYLFMIVLAVIFLGFSAFKISDSKNAPEDGWYEIIIPSGDPSVPSNQQIGGKLLSDPPTSGQGCATNNIGDLCSVFLTFGPNADEVPPSMNDLAAYHATSGADARIPK